MSVSLLATKLFFPRARRGTIPRPRLIERLVTGLDGPLTLVCAPAGYGKTTLLSEWRAGPGQDVPAAWLSLDANDGDLVLLMRYLVAALGALQVGLAEQTALLLESSPPPPPDVILTSLVNELSAFPGDTVLILDDYHEISAPEIHDTMAFLLAHVPPQVHLVLLTREDPPLPLPKLRARGQVVELREADLRFSPQEAAAFLSDTMGLSLPADTVEALAARTEGWAAGLQMAGLSLRTGDAAAASAATFEGRDRYVMDYLMDEVFRQQSEPIQAFLLRTSILERLSAPLCEALLEPGSPAPPRSSQQILEHLERANLFVIPLDNRREWYRYHHLFADLLCYRLERESPDLAPELHRRAAGWYAQVGSPDEAMHHAFAVPDHELAANLAEQFAIQMIGSSRLVAYLNWIQQLPEELVRSRAYLCAGCGWATVLRHRVEAAVRCVEDGEAALPHYEPVCDAFNGRVISREEVRGHLAAVRSYADREQGHLGAAIEHARQALDLLPREALAVRCAVALNLGFLYSDGGEIERARRAFEEAFEMASESRENVYVALSALASLGSIAVLQGKLNEAESLFERAIGCATGESGATMPVPAVGVVHGWLALLHYRRNEIETAQQHLDIVWPIAEQMGDAQVIVRTALYQALLDQSRGDFRAAEDGYQRVEQIIRDHRVADEILTEWLVSRGGFYLEQGDLPALLSLLSEQGLQPADLDDPEASRLGAHLGRYLVLARALLAQDQFDRAAALLRRICALAENPPNIPVYLEALILRAGIATHRQVRGDAAQALSTLQQALDRAAPEGYVRPFLNAGALLVKPLRQAVLQGIHPAYAQKLLAALSDQGRQAGLQRAFAEPQATRPGTPELVEPLTERETQVLRLLAAGLSSTEVAEELVIAVSTARSYIKSLYGKLDAHSRDEAIEQGHRYGLI